MNAKVTLHAKLLPTPKLAVNLDHIRLGWTVIAVLTSIILLVSINDVYWSFKTLDTLLENERNPLGRWLIRMDNGDIALFMTTKMVGTIVVVTALPLIYWIRKRIGLIVSAALAIFQIMLFLQLNFHVPLLAFI